MGLLNVINESGIDFESVPLPKKSNVKSNSVELLKKYVKESSESRLDFFEFTKKYNLNICAVLEKYNDIYAVSECIGFDGLSIIQTISTPDFWNGTIPTKNQWYRFQTGDDTISPFYQFLSFDFKEQIDNIYIYYCEENDKILMICSHNETDLSNDAELLEDFRLLVKEPETEIENEKIEISIDSQIMKYSIEVEKAVKTFLALNLKNLNYMEYFKQVLYKEIWYDLQMFFNRHYYVYHTSAAKFNFISFTKTEISDASFLEHLKKNLAYILDEEVSLINFYNFGKASSYSEITSFLKAE